MAKCDHCKQEMLSAPGCTLTHYNDFNDGIKRARLVYQPEDPEIKRCHDCGCQPGNYHHPGCDVEICPACGGQAIGCGCTDEEDEWWNDEEPEYDPYDKRGG